MKAIWKDVVIAESDDTVVVEGNHYFPPESITEGVLIVSEQPSPLCCITFPFRRPMNSPPTPPMRPAAIAWASVPKMALP